MRGISPAGAGAGAGAASSGNGCLWVALLLLLLLRLCAGKLPWPFPASMASITETVETVVTHQGWLWLHGLEQARTCPFCDVLCTHSLVCAQADSTTSHMLAAAAAWHKHQWVVT